MNGIILDTFLYTARELSSKTTILCSTKTRNSINPIDKFLFTAILICLLDLLSFWCLYYYISNKKCCYYEPLCTQRYVKNTLSMMCGLGVAQNKQFRNLLLLIFMKAFEPIITCTIFTMEFHEWIQQCYENTFKKTR